MSRLKKVFVAVAALISILTASFVISICSIKSNVGIAFGTPYSVVIFNNSTTGDEFKEETQHAKLQPEIYKLTDLTVYEKLVHKVTLDKKIYMDTSGKFSKWTTDLLNKNLVIEFIYTQMHDLVVYDGDDTRVISYCCLSLVIPNKTDYTEIAAYYSMTSNTENNEKNESYASNTPLILHGNAKEFVSFVDEFKKSK